MGSPFIHRMRVRYGECDRQGVVFNAHYFAYFDIAMTEVWRAAIGRYDAMVEQGVDMVVAEARARFLGSARFDDELEAEVAITRLGETSTTTRHRIRLDRQLLVEGEMRHVFVDAAAMTKTAIPAWVREALSPWVLDESGAASAGPG